MHVVMFGDQHPESSGGAQVSMRLQRRFLERAGHTVTLVAPAMHGAKRAAAPQDAAYVNLPSIPITPDREYSMSWPGRGSDRVVDAALAERPPVDIVHVQGDFWGAFTGHRFAERHGHAVVHTMHNRVDVGIEATAPFPAAVLRVLNTWQRSSLNLADGGGTDGWAYLRRFAALSRAVTAPSTHFAERLDRHGVVPAMSSSVDVVWNGIDDDVLDATLARGRTRTESARPHVVWIGRMSPEKRLLPFLRSIKASGASIDVTIVGGGGQRAAAERMVSRGTGAARVRFAGRLPYLDTLATIASADAVVQTSIGFETQGMTPFEGDSLGTPAVISDPDIAQELGAGIWAVPGGMSDSEDVRITALAEVLRQVADDVRSGRAPVPDVSVAERFRQSSRTAAMIDIYRRAL